MNNSINQILKAQANNLGVSRKNSYFDRRKESDAQKRIKPRKVTLESLLRPKIHSFSQLPWEILEKEENDLIVIQVREELFDNVWEECSKIYMHKESLKFTAECAITAIKQIVNIHFFAHDPGELNMFIDGELPYVADLEPEPSAPDTWAANTVPIKYKEKPQVPSSRSSLMTGASESLDMEVIHYSYIPSLPRSAKPSVDLQSTNASLHEIFHRGSDEAFDGRHSMFLDLEAKHSRFHLPDDVYKPLETEVDTSSALSEVSSDKSLFSKMTVCSMFDFEANLLDDRQRVHSHSLTKKTYGSNLSKFKCSLMNVKIHETSGIEMPPLRLQVKVMSVMNTTADDKKKKGQKPAKGSLRFKK